MTSMLLLSKFSESYPLLLKEESLFGRCGTGCNSIVSFKII